MQPDNARPVAVLTGGTSGLGRFIARGLVAAGHHLVLIARDPAKAAALRTWLGADASVEIEPADLSLLADARRAAAAILARHPAPALLVLNAGIFQPRRQVTPEGHEQVLAVNHLTPYVLTEAFAPCLPSGRGRIVAVGSSFSDRACIDPDNLELTRGWTLTRAYGQSKLAMMATSLDWAARLGARVAINVVHPGTVATDLIRVRGPIGWGWRALGLFSLTSEQGAATPLRAALDPALAGVTGRYLKPAGFASPNPRALDPALVARIRAATAALVQP